ncbi:MAG: phosphoethanolamine--lipid A transferase EptA [Draconibacterium sp.]
MLRKKIELSYFALIVSIVNLVLFHLPFYRFVCANTNIKSINGVLLLISLTVLAVVLNALVFYIGLYLLRVVGKSLLALFFTISAVALYFINTYSVLIERSMIGNVLNTNYEESSSFFSFTLILYVVFLGIVPGILIFKPQIKYEKFKKFLVRVSLTLSFLLLLIYANSTNWLWIDKNAKTLGALVMPWSYVVNTARYYHKESKENKKQILLPDATINDNEKSVMVLVIGESARSQNFSLYGYEKNTNPLLSEIENVHCFSAESSATYTTAGIKAILEHKNTSKLYEILPNYLYRTGVEVIWRTTNWGEPTVRIENYIGKNELRELCNGDNCEYDEVLLNGLKEQVLGSDKNKIFIVLHTSTSHGPSYYKKHPPRFTQFTPECENVELADCSREELINSYDNTIVYTDYILATLIEELKQLDGYNSSMIFVSDHGESLGENNLYMHGLPMSIAPKEQKEIPFIVWTSDESKKLKDIQAVGQHHVFHSVLNFLAIDSPVYDSEMDLFYN